MFRTAKQIHNLVEQAKHVLLVPHQNPDGDALGSVSAFARHLDNREKKHSVYCTNEASARYEFLSYSKKINTDKQIWQDDSVDLIIIFDSGDLIYAGVDEYIKKLSKPITIVNIDHHITNNHYGHHNLVFPHASSTAEVLFNFFKYNKIKIDKKMATSLLTGIITDTDNFTNSATSVTSLSAASDLIKMGGDLNLIKEWILKDKTIASLKLWGVILSRLSIHQKTEIVYTYITQNDLEKNNVTDAEIEGVANFLNNLNDGKAGLILKETEDKKIKGSFRTTRDDVDVSKMAKKFDGGGHKKAAGFTIEGPMEDAIDKVFREIK